LAPPGVRVYCLDDKRPDRRRRLVEKLLAGANYVNHFSNVWRALLLPETNNQQVQFLAEQIRRRQGSVRETHCRLELDLARRWGPWQRCLAGSRT
jgi:hypothetical protein